MSKPVQTRTSSVHKWTDHYYYQHATVSA